MPFGFNSPCQFAPLLNLRYVSFGLAPFDWLRSVMLNPYFLMGILFFYLRPLFQERN
jgi:hypothetical protein